MKYLETVGQKRAERQEQKHKQAALDAFNGLSKDIRDLLSSLEKTGAKTLDKDFVASVKALGEVAKKLERVKVESSEDIKQGLRDLAVAFSNLNVRPVVNIPAPKVEVHEREIDFKPLLDKLNTPVKVQEKVTEFKAQDLDDEETNQNIQYLGAVDPSGKWYIIENDLLMNTLRYKFGKKGYSKGWGDRAKHAYKLYNEAVNEI